MKEALWAYLILILGVVVVVVVTFVQRVTTTAEEDFYIGREVMQSAMLDAVDYSTYRTSGRIVMSKEKFVEVFIRRFAESVTDNKDYTLEFYDIYEEPPKASVRIKTTSGQEATVNMDSTDAEIDTLLNGILETTFEQYADQVEDSKKNQYIGRGTVDRVINNDTKVYRSLNATGDSIIIPSGSVVSLMLKDEIDVENKIDAKGRTNASSDLDKYSCNYQYNDESYCKIYYKGESYYIRRNNLSTFSVNDASIGEFNVNYESKKVCSSNTIESSTKELALQALQLKANAYAFKTSNSEKNKTVNGNINAEYGKCSVLNFVGSCMVGVDEYCELYDDGGYIDISKIDVAREGVTGCTLPTDDGNNSDPLISTDGVITGNKVTYSHSQQIFLVNEYENNSFVLNDNPSFIYSLLESGWFGNNPDEDDPVNIDSVSIPTKKGYVFSGYYTDMDGKGYMVINKDGKIVSTIANAKSFNYFLSSSHIYAYWTTKSQSKIYTITLDDQNGTGGTGKIYEVYGEKYTSDSSGKNKLDKVKVPSKSNYSFDGYYTATSGGTKYIDSTGSLTSKASSSHFNSNDKLYARWIGNTYKVDLDKNGGSSGTSTIYEKYGTGWYDKKDGKNISSITKPTKSGKTFDGYYTSKSGGIKVIDKDGKILSGKTTILDKAGALYAHWVDAIVCGSLTDTAIEKCSSNKSDSLCYSKSDQMTTIYTSASKSQQAGVIYGNASFRIVKTSGKFTLIAVKAGTKGVNKDYAKKCSSGSSYYCVWIMSTCLTSSNTKCCSAQ